MHHTLTGNKSRWRDMTSYNFYNYSISFNRNHERMNVFSLVDDIRIDPG